MKSLSTDWETPNLFRLQIKKFALYDKVRTFNWIILEKKTKKYTLYDKVRTSFFYINLQMGKKVQKDSQKSAKNGAKNVNNL